MARRRLSLPPGSRAEPVSGDDAPEERSEPRAERAGPRPFGPGLETGLEAGLGAGPGGGSGGGSASAPPIARAAAEAAQAGAEAARAARRLSEAEAEGRLLLDIPLEEIEAGHLARDRLPEAVPDEETAALMASLRAHGQRTPAEVVRLTGGGAEDADGTSAAGQGGRPWGLVSGWRRLSALQALHRETGEPRFARLRALVRGEGEASGAEARGAGAYVAMVEENEIRLGLTPYERGRIAVIAAERGAFESLEAAVDALFAAASRAKRSKIRSFAAVHRALGDRLRHPAGIPERLGLRLAEAAAEAPGRAALREALEAADPARGAEAERALLTRTLNALRGENVSRAKRAAASEEEGLEVLPGLVVTERRGRGGPVLALSGPRAEDPETRARLRALLAELAGRGAGGPSEGP